jgi:hypothetical protein
VQIDQPKTALRLLVRIEVLSETREVTLRWKVMQSHMHQCKILEAWQADLQVSSSWWRLETLANLTSNPRALRAALTAVF